MLSHGGLPEVPCAKCGTRVRGLSWGALCPTCAAEQQRRARRLSARVALGTAIAVALYVALTLPADPTARYYGALAIVVTYLLVRRIAQRIALEVMK